MVLSSIISKRFKGQSHWNFGFYCPGPHLSGSQNKITEPVCFIIIIPCVGLLFMTPCQWFEGLYPWIIPARYTISFRVLSVRFKHSWTEIEVLSCPVSSTVSWALTAKTNAGSCFPSPDLNYRPLTPDGWFYHTSKTVYHTELSEPTAHSSLKELNIWYF